MHTPFEGKRQLNYDGLFALRLHVSDLYAASIYKYVVLKYAYDGILLCSMSVKISVSPQTRYSAAAAAAAVGVVLLPR